jgi:amidase
MAADCGRLTPWLDCVGLRQLVSWRYFVRLIRTCLLLSCFPISVAAQNAPASSSADDVHFKGTIDNVKYVFGVAPPVARLRPGNILDANSLDCFGNGIQKPGDTTAMAKGDNPLTGPFFIEGAEPGDTLVVRILDLQVDGNQGVGAFSPGFGAINSTHYTPVLEKEALAEKIWFYPIDHADNTATFQALDSNFKVKIPMHPFLGCIGVAPANGEARSSIVPAEFGGNMDAPEVSVGNTLYLPVNVAGALFYFGDGHAAMGDGEVAGSAIEVPMRVRLQFDVVKGKRTGWPRFENEKEIMATGIYRPVDDAVRIAFTELVAWIHADYGLSELDAYELLSKVGKIHLTEMVDPNYVVVASVEKKYLPKRVADSPNRSATH